MKKLLLAFICFSCQHVYAACTINSAPAENWVAPVLSLSFGSIISVNPDILPGASLQTTIVNENTLSGVYCGNNKQATATNSPSLFSVKSNLTGVYKTNVPGIGIKALLTYTGTDPNIWWENQSETNIWLRWGGQSLKFYLVRTDEPLSGGTLTTGTVDNIRIVNTSETSESYQLFTVNLTSPTVIQFKSCTVDTPNINVPLGDVPAGNFTGVSRTVASKNFTVKLDCLPSTLVKATLTGTQSAETTNQSVLALTNAGDDNVAKGVGVQIVYGSTPLIIGSTISTQTSPGGVLNLTFAARYYQTKATVNAGEANATATLNLTYQ